ncbi:hypothetical protein Pan44_17940 [Caulifigura coniformis]|uniref:Uncharacterized protein n=1 Tax=Caulifigura coniformis TaxID=2527983 RepID=A0A517SCB6_9PLAN|nr:hypothetical protein [Caulifigura coniformis]QDT53771.1 hypothetical protein Pan44_17940 [Caulifigura coniformis]
MATPVGTILCAGMLSLATGILLTAALITACFDPPIDRPQAGIRKSSGDRLSRNDQRQITTAA